MILLQNINEMIQGTSLIPLFGINTCVEWALQLVNAMHVRDVARVDFIVDDRWPVVP